MTKLEFYDSVIYRELQAEGLIVEDNDDSTIEVTGLVYEGFSYRGEYYPQGSFFSATLE